MNLFTLMATVSLEDSEFTRGINNATEQGESFGKKIGGVMVGAGKAVATGLAVGATALGALSVKALQLGGDLEQNMGGAEAVFGSFADTVKTKGETAFSSMGLAQADFLATSNKMGALFQGVGFGVEESANLSTEAMQRAADVASIMGVDVEFAMESVAGAAKGNFSMMDNLGVSINDTAINAYALEKGLSKTTAEMSTQEKVGLAMEMFMEKTAYAAGNYAKENETLAGSLETAKSSLSNFLSGAGNTQDVVNSVSNAANVIVKNLTDIIPRLAEGIPQIIQALLPKIQPLLNQLLPALLQGATTLINGIVAVMPQLMNVIIAIIPQIINAIMELLPTLLDAGMQILIALINGIAQSLPMLIPVIVQTLLTIIDILIDNIDLLIDAAVQIMLGLTMGLIEALPILIEKVPIIIQKLTDAILNNLPILIAATIQIILAISVALIKNAPLIFKAVQDIIKTMVNYYNELPKKIMEGLLPLVEMIATWFLKIDNFLITKTTALLKAMVGFFEKLPSDIMKPINSVVDSISQWGVNIYNAGVNGVKKMIDGIVSATSKLASMIWNAIVGSFNIVSKWGKEMATKGKEAITDFSKAIVSVAKKIPEKMYEIGKNIVEGVWNGIKNAKDQLVKNVTGFFNDIVGAAKKTLDIHSPSKRFKKEIGEMIPEGTAEGIISNEKVAIKASKEMSEKVYQSAKAWIDNYRKEEDYLASEELLMWENLSKEYTKTSKQKIEIDKNVAKLKKQILAEQSAEEERQFNKTKNWIETKKNLGLLSLEEEVRAWEKAQVKFKKGTDARKQADAELYNAEQRLIEQQKDLRNQIEQTESRYQEALKSRTQSIFESFGLFDELQKKEDVSGETLSKNLKDQVEEMRDWSNNLDELAKRGIDEGLLEELRKMNPAANAEIGALADMTDEELSAYAELWREKHQLAREQAVKELAQLKVETDEEIRVLSQGLTESVGLITKPIGTNMVQGMIDGIVGATDELAKAFSNAISYAMGQASAKDIFGNVALPNTANVNTGGAGATTSTAATNDVTIIQNIQSIPQTPWELAQMSRGAFTRATWGKGK